MKPMAASPAGVNRYTASGLLSLTRCTNGANSGFFKGTRSSPTTSPPNWVNAFLKARAWSHGLDRSR